MIVLLLVLRFLVPAQLNLIASGGNIFACTDHHSHFCRLCNKYFDHSHGVSKEHRYQVKYWKSNMNMELYPVPAEASEQEQPPEEDGRDKRQELSLTEDDLTDVAKDRDRPWRSERSLPPWAAWLKTEDKEGLYCKACGRWIDSLHLASEGHENKVLWNSAKDYTYLPAVYSEIW